MQLWLLFLLHVTSKRILQVILYFIRSTTITNESQNCEKFCAVLSNLAKMRTSIFALFALYLSQCDSKSVIDNSVTIFEFESPCSNILKQTQIQENMCNFTFSLKDQNMVLNSTMKLCWALHFNVEKLCNEKPQGMAFPVKPVCIHIHMKEECT